ncbi:MAG: endonuclease/exonuclease/phosphatase family protein [Lacunisphaera sp.]
MTFNIAHARGLSLHQGLRSVKQLCASLTKIATLIRRLNADIVALQEIDENSRWSGSFDHLAFLREHTGLPYSAFGINNRRIGHIHLNYGNAVLSRFPIVHAETVPFGAGKIGEKGFIFVEIELSKRQRLPLFNIHMHHSSRAQRLKQVIHLMHYLDEQHLHRSPHWGAPPIVCGDFNNPSHWPDATSTLLGYFEQTNNYTLLPKTGRTFPSPFPARALDYIFLPQECQQPKAEVVRCMLSDHRPVLVEFGLPD